MGANAVLFTSGRKPRCSALTRRLVKRFALGLRPSSASVSDIGINEPAHELTLLLGLYSSIFYRASSSEIDAKLRERNVLDEIAEGWQCRTNVHTR